MLIKKYVLFVAVVLFCHNLLAEPTLFFNGIFLGDNPENVKNHAVKKFGNIKQDKVSNKLGMYSLISGINGGENLGVCPWHSNGKRSKDCFAVNFYFSDSQQKPILHRMHVLQSFKNPVSLSSLVNSMTEIYGIPDGELSTVSIDYSSQTPSSDRLLLWGGNNKLTRDYSPHQRNRLLNEIGGRFVLVVINHESDDVYGFDLNILDQNLSH